MVISFYTKRDTIMRNDVEAFLSGFQIIDEYIYDTADRPHPLSFLLVEFAKRQCKKQRELCNNAFLSCPNRMLLEDASKAILTADFSPSKA